MVYCAHHFVTLSAIDVWPSGSGPHEHHSHTTASGTIRGLAIHQADRHSAGQIAPAVDRPAGGAWPDHAY